MGEEVERRKVEIESIEDLKEFLRGYFRSRNVEIYLFGSRARGDNSEFSDVDLAVIAKENVENDLVVLREIIENSNLPYKVDLVDVSRNESLMETVLREGVKWL